jgi:hypothetical protein
MRGIKNYDLCFISRGPGFNFTYVKSKMNYFVATLDYHLVIFIMCPASASFEMTVGKTQLAVDSGQFAVDSWRRAEHSGQ